MIKTRKLLPLTAGLVFSMTASAHHGANSNPDLYLAENLIELDGEISGVLWRNPHPRLMMTVTGEDGEEAEWELEFSGSVNGWVRQGVDAEFFQIGDQVKTAGVVSRRDPTSIGLLHLLLPSGEEMVSGNRELRWSDEQFAMTGRRTFDREEIAAAEAAANGIFRVWGQRTSGRPHPEEYAGLLTEHGRELAAQYYGPTDNPELECRTGIPTHMFDPVPMEIADGGDRIHIQTLEYNVKRAVYLTDDRPEPAPSNVGYSVGRWDGDTLIVETTHIDWPYFDPYGTPQSGQMSYVETFRVADDDSRLDYTIIATDPVMFTEPVRLERAWRWQPGTEMYEFDCVGEWERSE
ncbi:MAG: DUF6152 family protein [Gammaproteobacteria bacterium]